MPRPGDLVVFLHAGAYGFTQSMPLFLSHEWAAELGRRGAAVHALRRATSVAELRREQQVPAGLGVAGSLGHSAVNSAQPAKEIASNGSSTGDCPGSERNCRNAGPAPVK